MPPDLAIDLCRAVESRAARARDLLLDLIRIPSVTPNEGAAAQLIAQRCRDIGLEAEQVPFPADIKQDPDYTFTEQELDYTGRANVVAVRRGAGARCAAGGRSLILQSHLDVVPAQSWGQAFEPANDGDFVIGRGAADAKGQVAAIWLAMQALADVGAPLRGEVQAQFVIEEEVGGNGALALIAQGYRADAVLIMECTNLQVHPANRGAIWFRLRVAGKSVHMGRAHEGVNAIEKMAALLPALREYERRLVAESAHQPLFERYERPVQVNLGTMRAGDWPSTVPGEATLEGGVGFLPNKSMAQIKRELREAIQAAADDWTRAHYELDFPKLHNDAYADDPNHPAVAALAQACRDVGIATEVFGWNVSCDARLYHHRGKMPTVVFGPGQVSDAHAAGERIDFRQVVKAAQAAALLCARWCDEG
jgi:acetylornithine deacetylase